MNRLVEHDGISILVELGGVRRMAHKIVRSYYKRKNALLLEEVERWDLDGVELGSAARGCAGCTGCSGHGN